MSAWTKEELLAYLRRVEPRLARMSHFDLLDIDHTASEVELQHAYHQMAARLHPDMYRLVLAPADLERLSIVYGRIADAYLVLRDPLQRDRYLVEQSRSYDAEREGDVDPTAAAALLSPRAKQHYRRAQAALRAGEVASAILSLRMALSHNPHSALLREILLAAESLKQE